MFGKKKLSNNNAVNEILGTILLLGISVSIFSIVYMSVLTFPYTPSTPSANIYFSMDDTKIVLTHYGGKELDLESEVRVIIGDDTNTVKVSDNGFLDDEDGDNYWGFGEQFVYDTNGAEVPNPIELEVLLENSVQVTVVDQDSNSVVFIGRKMKTGSEIGNNPPEVTDIPDQTIAEGGTFTTISLDDYVSDAEDADADISWGYSGNTELTVDITDRVATITTPSVDWNGAETITFTATDTGTATDSDDALFTVTQESEPEWTLLTYDDFEDGWGNFSYGGGDCELYTDGEYAHQGDNAVNIQDDSNDASSFYYTNGRDVDTPGYTSIKIDFWFLTSVSNGDSFIIEYLNVSTYVQVERLNNPSDFINDQFYHKTIWINESNYGEFPNNIKIKFECDSGNNNDDVYIDEIFVYAR